MSKTLAIILSFIFAGIAASAEKFKKPDSSRVIMGTVNGQELRATRFDFKYVVHDYDFDSAANKLFIVFRNPSWSQYNKNELLVSFDLATHTIDWKKWLATTSFITYAGDKVIIAVNGHTKCFSKKDLKELWYINEEIILISAQANIGYTMSGNGIDLATGQKKWTYPIASQYGWANAQWIDSTNMIIEASGIHKLNMKTGQGWSYTVQTGITDYDPVAIANVYHVPVKTLLKATRRYGGYDFVNRANSNIVYDTTGNIYYACKTHIACLNKDGQEVWAKPFGEDSVGRSLIALLGDKLLFINKAYGMLDGRRRMEYGQPYIALFDKVTGKTFYKQEIPIPRMVQEVYIDSVNMVLNIISEKDILKYDIGTGSIIKRMTLNADFEYLGWPLNMHNYFLHLKANDEYKSFNDVYPGHLLLYHNDKNTVQRYNADLVQVDSFETKHLLPRVFLSDNTTYLVSGDTTLLINNDKKTGFIKGSKGIVRPNALIGIGQNHIVIADAADVEF